jgi:hypothetical protein
MNPGRKAKHIEGNLLLVALCALRVTMLPVPAEGQGTLNGSMLTVDWGQPDPVIYQVMHDGTLEGTWARGRAKESLTPAE